MTPYHYGYNNPIVYKYLFGLLEDWYENENGEIVYDENVKSQQDMNDRGIKGTYLGEQGTAIDENTGKTIVYNSDGTTSTAEKELAEVVVTARGNSSGSSSSTASADWFSSGNLLGYAGGVQSVYEGAFFSRHKFDYRPSKGPNADSWTTVWKTNKAGEAVTGINASPANGYRILKESKNAVKKFNAGRILARTGKALGALGVVATIADGASGTWKSYHTADVIIGVAMTFGPVGWIGGLTYLAADLVTQGVTGKSITENLFDGNQ